MKLVDICIKDRGNGWSLWWLEDGDLGAAIGELDNRTSKKYRDVIIAERVAARSAGATRSTPRTPWTWSDYDEAEAALRAIVAEVNAEEAETPLKGWMPT